MRKLLPLLLLLMCAPAFATVSLSLAGLVELVIYLIVVGAILALLIWLIGYAGVPEPFAKIARIIMAEHPDEAAPVYATCVDADCVACEG